MHFVVKPGHGPDWHRLLLPMESLPIQEGDTLSMAVYAVDETPELFDCDVLVFNRSLATPADQLVRLQKRYGFKIVLDLDDYWELGQTHPLYHSWRQNGHAEEILSYVKVADLVTVTNETLASKARVYNQSVAILPNALVCTTPQIRPRFNKMHFLYAGSVTHIPDIEILRNRFRRIDPHIRDRASFILAGVGEHPGWKRPKEVFAETGSYEFLPVLPLDQYMNHYDKADVALVPLADNDFNSCKSVLKVIEAASRGVPCIVSQVQPYYPELKDAPVMWVSDGSDWLRHIRFCIKNPNWVVDQGKQLHDYIKTKYSFDDINKQRYEVLRGIVHKQG